MPNTSLRGRSPIAGGLSAELRDLVKIALKSVTKKVSESLRNC